MFEWKFDAIIYRKAEGEILFSKMCDTYEEAQSVIEENIIRFVDSKYPPIWHINKNYVQVY